MVRFIYSSRAVGVLNILSFNLVASLSFSSLLSFSGIVLSLVSRALSLDKGIVVPLYTKRSIKASNKAVFLLSLIAAVSLLINGLALSLPARPYRTILLTLSLSLVK